MDKKWWNCWFLHKWGKWVDCAWHNMYQERCCTICNKKTVTLKG